MNLSRLTLLISSVLARNLLLMIKIGTLSELVNLLVYLRGGLGVGAFRRIYGGSKRNGSRPSHFCKSSGGIARHILQQLETMNIVELDTKG
ncbi:unnamed protein product [Cochlearia groenlandica]